MFCRISAAFALVITAAAVLSLGQTAHAAPPVAKPVSKAPVKNLSKTPPARPISGLVGVNKQLRYSNSSTFAQSRRVMRTERSNVLRGGTATLWESDRSDEAQRLQRRSEQRARARQQQIRLQKSK